MDFYTIFILMCIVPSGLSRILDASPANVFSVLKYGAVGDGSTDDSKAFLNAWNDMCGARYNAPTLEVPAGKTFMLGSVVFEGPCKSTSVRVSILGNLVALQMSAWGSDRSKWISFANVNGLIVDGRGQLDGRGDQWWKCAREAKPDVSLWNDMSGCQRPTSLAFHACKTIQLSGITSINSPSNHFSINEVDGATISNVHLTAPEESPNTDGIDITDSRNIQIEESIIATGDDCVAINGGTSFINITNVACGPGHGISVGSLGDKGGKEDTVEEIRVQNCNFTGTTNGLRIKTFAAGTGYARKIHFDQITFQDVKNAIIIDQYYCPHGQCEGGASSNIRLSDISYTGVQGSTTELVAINLNCSSTVPCSNIFMNGVNIVADDPGSTTSASCSNAQGKAISTIPDVSCLEA
ncbi:hypothetical protein IFM89_026142 [Coptis chinensis]|uniref:Polygalacturonase n=1 Tax=Coptis chinensis TaxID=261450 RepID=A0A835M455_9MAGN|nr:hypothetical protein IFM89_026142 [Coptis chinensis]